MITHMMNKRMYFKPECILLDEQIEITLMQATSAKVEDSDKDMGMGGDGDGNNMGAREGFFDEDGW